MVKNKNIIKDLTMLIQQLIPRLRSWLITPGQRGLSSTEQGSVLVATIIAVTIAASLGTAIYSFVSTSQFTQIGSMNDTKAYYLAESGGHYGVKQLMLHPPADATACNTLLAKTYTVTDAGQFTILPDCTRTAASGYAEYRFTSKGTPTDAAISRQISYIIQLPDPGGVNIPFDGSGSTLKAENWNTSGTTARVDDSTVTLNSSGSATQASLDWNNQDSTLPKLSTVWSGDGKMLSYEVQAKVKLNSLDSKDVAAGISFRLKTQNNSSFTDDSFYALSYLWCGNSSANQLDSLCGSNTSHTYIVLWKQNASGVKTVIGRQRASSISGSLVDSNDKLKDWATLVVRIQEQIDPTTEVRENMIYAFVGDPTTNPKGTIAWDYTNFATVKWAADSFFTGLDCSGGLKAYVADSDYLTTNFDTQPQDEVGVHALGGTSGQVADLALRFSFNGGQSSVCTSTGPGAIYLKSATSSISEGGGTVTITAGRKNGASGAVGVNYATVGGGTATAGSDYTAASGTLSWSALNIADQTFTIPIIDDTDYESDETVNLALTTPTGGATLGTPSTAVLTITDNDGVRVLNSWPATSINSGTSNSLSGTFATSTGSNRFLVCAVTSELSDYTTSFAVSGTYGGKGFTTLKSTTGLSNRQQVWLGYIKESDLASRTGDTVSLTITAGKSVDAADLSCGSYQGVDQANPIAGTRANSNSSGSSTVSFGGNLTVINGGYAIYAVAANGASSTPPAGYLEHWDKSINGYSTSGGSKRVTASGSDNKSWSLNSSERWGLAVASLKPGASGAIAGTISFSTTAYSVNEGGGTATITTSRLDGASGAVSVSYATANGTASAGADYTTASGTLSWADGDTADQTFTVPITDDTAFEASETINLTLSGPTNGAVLGDASVDLTIVDNETGITVDDPWLAVKSGTSGSMSGSFTTSAGANRLLVCAVTTELSDVTTSFSVSGTYGSKGFTLLKSTSSLSSRQHVWLGYVKESDIASHGSDTVSMTISAGKSVSAADLYCGSYAGVDQSNPVVDSRANSNSGSSSPSFGGNVNVLNGGYILYAVAANGASSTPPSGYSEHWDKAANSYSTSGGSKNITANGTEDKSCTLNSSERWGLAVGSLRPGAGGGAGAGTIDLSATTYSVNENGGTATITAKRSGGSTGAVGVSYATSNGTATAGSDYGSASGALTWADGDTADQTFTVNITDDSTVEGNETVNLTLSAPTGGATLGTASAVLTIADNDAGVTVLNAWPLTPQLTATTGNMSGSFAISAGANRLLVVAISCYDSGGANGQTFTVTYGGKTLTQAKLENSNRRQTWIGYLKESDIASKSSDTVSVSISGSHDDATALVASYQNVNQGTPVAASGSTYINDTNNVAVSGSALNVGAGKYGLYVWSGTQGVSRSSDTESYTEHADKDINSDFRVGIASKAFTAAGTTNPKPAWSANIRASVSIIVLQ